MKLIIYLALSVIVYLVVKKEEKSYTKSIHEKCRNCGMVIKTDILACPYCKEKIERVCDCCGRLIDIEECGSLLGIEWRYCPFCENKELNREMKNISIRE